jgi:hypothetical protein
MIINELSKQLGVKNKELIDFLKSKGFKVSSHMQTLTDEMIDAVESEFVKQPEKVEEKKTAPVKKITRKPVPTKNVKKFSPDDQIPCRSLVPWKLVDVSVDKNTIYSWSGYGDIEYVSYRDLQAMRRRSMVKDARIMIEDPDICEQWKHDLGDLYNKYLGVEYPEEFFDLSDEKFEAMLKDAPDVFKEVIKYTALDMIRNENYPSLRKISIIDNLLGTGLKEFI